MDTASQEESEYSWTKLTTKTLRPLQCCPHTEMHILCHYSYNICVHFNVLNPFRPWSSQQSLPFKFFKQHFMRIYDLSGEHRKVSACLQKPQLSRKQMAVWNFGSTLRRSEYVPVTYRATNGVTRLWSELLRRSLSVPLGCLVKASSIHDMNSEKNRF